MGKTIFQSHILPMAKIRTSLQLKLCNIEPRDVISLYTAAFGVNSSDWLGKTLIRVKSDKARIALEHILLCESVENRVATLLHFARMLSATPGNEVDKRIRYEISEIRSFFTDLKYAGLKGLALFASLKSLSLDFIPYITQCALDCDCKDFQYVNAHRETDIKHSKQLCEALEAEVEEFSEADVNHVLVCVDSVVEKLLKNIFEYRK